MSCTEEDHTYRMFHGRFRILSIINPTGTFEQPYSTVILQEAMKNGIPRYAAFSQKFIWCHLKLTGWPFCSFIQWRKRPCHHLNLRKRTPNLDWLIYIYLNVNISKRYEYVTTWIVFKALLERVSDALLCTARSRWAGGGYSEQLNQLWTPQGKLLGQCRQLMAML